MPYAFVVVDHYGNRSLVDRDERDRRAGAGRVADWRRVNVPAAWLPPKRTAQAVPKGA